MLWPCFTNTADWAVTATEEWLGGCFILPKCWDCHPDGGLLFGRLVLLFSQVIMDGEWEKCKRRERENPRTTLPGSVKCPPRKLQGFRVCQGFRE